MICQGYMSAKIHSLRSTSDGVGAIHKQINVE